MTIDLAEGLSLPDDAVTKSYALLGMKGSGKSNAAVVMAEEFYAAQIPFVVVDPKGDWWGIRSSARGAPGGGIPAVIFGGLHADVPIDATAGATIAELVTREHLTCLIDTSEFTKGESIRFLHAFFDRLYREKNRATFPLHVFLEEADDYVPQKVYRDVAQLVRSVEVIVKRGRQRGLGITLASQRSASINKDVLSQTDTLVALRTTAPQDRNAIKGWLTWHAGDTTEILDELPTLEDGAAWVSSPAQLKILKRVRFRRRRTFDSGATPELGEKVKPATLADIDIAAVTAALGEQIERAKADDPKVLRAQIVQLTRELDQARRARVDEPDRIEVEVVHEIIPPEVPRALEKTLTIFAAAICDMQRGRDEIAATLAKLQDRPDLPRVTSPPKFSAAKSHPRPTPVATSAPRTGDNAPTKVLRAIVQTRQPITKKRAAALAGISPKSSTLRGALAELRRDGLIDGDGQQLTATAAGIAAAGDVTLPTGTELIEHWRSELGTGAPRQILDAHLTERRALTKDELASLTGISAASSTMRGGLARLRSLGLLNGDELDPDFEAAIT